MKTLTAILAVFVLGTFAVGQSRPTASLTAADKPAINEVSCRNTASTLSTLANFNNEAGQWFPALPMMTLGETTSVLSQCLSKFEWSNVDTARLLSLSLAIITDQASRSAHFIGQQGLWKTFIEQDESAANLAMRNEQ